MKSSSFADMNKSDPEGCGVGSQKVAEACWLNCAVSNRFTMFCLWSDRILFHSSMDTPKCLYSSTNLYWPMPLFTPLIIDQPFHVVSKLRPLCLLEIFNSALIDSEGLVVNVEGGDPRPAISRRSLRMWFRTTSAWYFWKWL